MLTKCCVLRTRASRGPFLRHSTVQPPPREPGDRSSITSKLWELRLRLRENLNPNRLANQPQVEVQTKGPKDSYVEIVLPFATDPILRGQYISPWGAIRYGRLFEDLDALAGNIAFIHADDNDPNTKPVTLVTASMDRLDLFERVDLPSKHLKLYGNVSWVGNSSMEVKVRAAYANEVPNDDPEKAVWKELFCSYFSMVAKSVETGKAQKVNRLLPQTEFEKKDFEQGEVNQQKRLKFRQESIYSTPPTQAERDLRHQIHIHARTNPEDFFPMSKTERQTTILCQRQQRNLHGKLFGGYLMRVGFELAFTCAFCFAECKPFFKAVGNVTFQRPVSIGSILGLKAQVVYVDTEKNKIQVEVVAAVVLPEEGGRSEVTNTFTYTFDVPGLPAGKKLRQILPVTYEETLRFWDGKRRYEDHSAQ